MNKMFAFFVIFGGLTMPTAFAQDIEKPRLLADTAQNKTLVVEQVFPYTLIRYKPLTKLNLLKSRSEESYSGPEDALRSHFSSMHAKDYDWFLGTWSAASKQQMQLQNHSRGRDAAFWVAAWGKALSGKQIELTSWLNYGKYVLIEYRIVSGTGDTNSFTDTIAMVKEKNQWKLTQELSADPILSHWNSPSGRVQIPSNTAISK